MSTKVSKPQSDFEQVPEGTFIARCYSLIILGTQETTYKGEIKHKQQCLIQWELLDEEGKTKEGKPFTIGKKYTQTLDERGKLFPDLNAWRGRRFTPEELEEFDLVSIVGAYAMLQVLHDTNESTGKTYANVSALMPYKGEKPAPVNDNLIFDIEEPDAAVFNHLPDYWKLKIQSAPEFTKLDGMVLADPKTTNVTPTKSDDVVLEELPDTDSINLDDIPF